MAAKKLKCIQYKGIHCKRCGLNLGEYPWLAHFHHRDPSTKEMGIMNVLGLSLSLSRVCKELDKCDLLCGQCHSTIHFPMELYLRTKNKIFERAAALDFNDKYFVSADDALHFQRLADQGDSLFEIAQSTGFSVPTIRKNTLGQPFGNERIRKITNDELKAERAAGVSLREISIKYKMAYKTVWKRWKKLTDATFLYTSR